MGKLQFSGVAIIGLPSVHIILCFYVSVLKMAVLVTILFLFLLANILVHGVSIRELVGEKFSKNPSFSTAITRLLFF